MLHLFDFMDWAVFLLISDPAALALWTANALSHPLGMFFSCKRKVLLFSLIAEHGGFSSEYVTERSTVSTQSNKMVFSKDKDKRKGIESDDNDNNDYDNDESKIINCSKKNKIVLLGKKSNQKYANINEKKLSTIERMQLHKAYDIDSLIKSRIKA